VAKRLYRHAIGIEIVPEYVEMIKAELETKELQLFESRANYEITQSQRSD
jgi:DNA modification methylase